MSKTSNVCFMITALIATAPACALDPASDSSYASSETTLEPSEAPALDTTPLPAGWEVVDGMPPGAVVAVAPDDLAGASVRCPGGFVCLFQNANGGGTRVAISLPAGVGINLTGVPCPHCTTGNFNDQMSSWENASSVRYCWAFDINGGGERVPMRAGAPLQNVPPRQNDQASSVDRLGCP